MTGTIPRDSLRLRLEGVAWLIGWRIARALPERWVVGGFERLSMRSYRRNHARRALVERNLAPIVPPERLDETVREAFMWYGRYWAETFRMQDLSSDELNRRFRITGVEHLERANAAGRGAVYAVPHLGNWDSGGRWAAERWPLVAVAEVLRPRAVFDRFIAHRRALGLQIIPLERGGDVTARCLERIARGEFVALVCDRDLSGNGVEVEMFGRRTKMPPGPAVLAMRTGAPLIPAAIYQCEDGTWDTVILDPLPVPEIETRETVAEVTQRLARAFESLIARAPAQWHMFSPYWIDA